MRGMKEKLARLAELDKEHADTYLKAFDFHHYKFAYRAIMHDKIAWYMAEQTGKGESIEDAARAGMVRLAAILDAVGTKNEDTKRSINI